MGDFSTRHAQFEFSRTADCCFSHCVELITENHTHHVNLTCRKVYVISRCFEMFSYILNHDFRAFNKSEKH